MAEGIFISYRRQDTAHVAGRLAGDLSDRFGVDRVFRDVDSIGLGEEFPKRLNRALDGCAVMLVLIGGKWLEITDQDGRRRLEDPNDWVRLEIATALERNIIVVPVRVDDAPLPSRARLPPDLQRLLDRQQLLLSDERWKGDLQNLVDDLSRRLGVTPAGAGGARSAPAPAPPASPATPEAPPPQKSKRLRRVVIAVVVLLVVLWGLDAAGVFEEISSAFDAT